ncbi:hypothetical protein PG990_003303 [Apiospora arundinis]
MNNQENYLYHKRSSEGAVTHHHDNTKNPSTGKTTSPSTVAPLDTSVYRYQTFLANPGRLDTAQDNMHPAQFVTSPALGFGSLAGARQLEFDRTSGESNT